MADKTLSEEIQQAIEWLWSQIAALESRVAHLQQALNAVNTHALETNSCTGEQHCAICGMHVTAAHQDYCPIPAVKAALDGQPSAAARDREALKGEAIRAFVARVNARAEAEMLSGHPVTGAHHRAIEAELALLTPEADQRTKE